MFLGFSICVFKVFCAVRRDINLSERNEKGQKLQYSKLAQDLVLEAPFLYGRT